MTPSILTAWTISAGITAVGLGVWLCVKTLVVGTAMVVLGFLVTGLGVRLVEECTQRRCVACRARTAGQVFHVASHPCSRDALPRRRKVA
ncbi:MAG: hypothetical protein ACE5E6_05275 [Phycisphaerae bacterium]